MTDADFCTVDGRRYTLTLADKAGQEAAARAGGGNGRGELVHALAKLPLAKSERGWPRRADHVHLSRADGTDLVQWMGRYSDGYHRPIGRVMRIVEVSPPE